jgi:hypothetical protein
MKSVPKASIIRDLSYLAKYGKCKDVVALQKGRDHWEDQDVGGWTILKLILER